MRPRAEYLQIAYCVSERRACDGVIPLSPNWRLDNKAPDTATAVVAAEFDLHDRASDVAPEAVEHLLIDVLDEAGLSNEQVTIGAMAAACSQLQLTTPIDAPLPLLVVDVVVGGHDPNGLVRALQGPMPAPAAATALFRDLQIRRLLADDSHEDGPGD